MVLENAYVLQSTYRIAGDKGASLIRDLLALPGLLVTDECPRKRLLDLWPSPFSSLADAALVAIAVDKRYDAVATFDQKLSSRLKNFSVAAYW